MNMKEIKVGDFVKIDKTIENHKRGIYGDLSILPKGEGTHIKWVSANSTIKNRCISEFLFLVTKIPNPNSYLMEILEKDTLEKVPYTIKCPKSGVELDMKKIRLENIEYFTS